MKRHREKDDDHESQSDYDNDDRISPPPFKRPRIRPSDESDSDNGSDVVVIKNATNEPINPDNIPNNNTNNDKNINGSDESLAAILNQRIIDQLSVYNELQDWLNDRKQAFWVDHDKLKATHYFEKMTEIQIQRHFEHFPSVIFDGEIKKLNLIKQLTELKHRIKESTESPLGYQQSLDYPQYLQFSAKIHILSQNQCRVLNQEIRRICDIGINLEQHINNNRTNNNNSSGDNNIDDIIEIIESIIDDDDATTNDELTEEEELTEDNIINDHSNTNYACKSPFNDTTRSQIKPQKQLKITDFYQTYTNNSSPKHIPMNNNMNNNNNNNTIMDNHNDWNNSNTFVRNINNDTIWNNDNKNPSKEENDDQEDNNNVNNNNIDNNNNNNDNSGKNINDKRNNFMNNNNIC